LGGVVGVDKTGHAEELRDGGADMIVTDLAQVDAQDERGESSSRISSLSSALESMQEIRQVVQSKRLAVFLDYDGTLTPIVERPEDAVLSKPIRSTLSDLADYCTVAIISGRDLHDVRERVDVDKLFYAGSHGFDISGPTGWVLEFQQGKEFLHLLDQAERTLLNKLRRIEGARVERERFSIAVHYRTAEESNVDAIDSHVNEMVAKYPKLRKANKKKICEIQPKIVWHKGKAVLWLLEELILNSTGILPIYIGDDVTDEDAFEALKGRGIGILVGDKAGKTSAKYSLNDIEEVETFLRELILILKGEK
jgi:trehalose-phosphatase